MYLPRKGTLVTVAYIPKASLSCYPPRKSSEHILHQTEEEMTKDRPKVCLVLRRQRPDQRGSADFILLSFFNTI